MRLIAIILVLLLYGIFGAIIGGALLLILNLLRLIFTTLPYFNFWECYVCGLAMSILATAFCKRK